MTSANLLYVFPTYAAAETALLAGSLPNDARVEVERDETHGQRRYRYSVYVESPPSIAPPALIQPEPLPTLDTDGRLAERLAPGGAGVIDSADYATFAAAINAVNAAAPGIQGLRLRAGVHVVDTPLATDDGVELLFDPGAVVDLTHHLAGLTLRAPVRASRRQIFRYTLPGGEGRTDGPGESVSVLPGPKVVFENLARGPVPVEWFGVLPQNDAADNDLAIHSVLWATRISLDGRPGWLPVSFGLGNFDFGAPIAFGPRSVRGEGHLITNRAKRGSGYGQPFSGTVLRFRTLDSGVAVSFGEAGTSPSPFRVEGLAIIGPNNANSTTTSTGLSLSQCIEASFENVCVASFAVGIDVVNAQGCSFDRLNVFGCEVGVQSSAGAQAASNTVSNFDINNCETGVALGLPRWTPPPTTPLPDPQPPIEGDLAADPPIQIGAKEWRFLGGTIQGGDLRNGRNLYLKYGMRLGTEARACVVLGVYFEVTVPAEPAAGATVEIVGGDVNAFYGCRFHGPNSRVLVEGSGGAGQHAFRDCRSDDGTPVRLVAAKPGDAPVVTFDNCQNLELEGATGLARVVGGYNPKTATDEVDRAPARLGLDQDAGLIPWTEAKSAPLQFRSVKPYVHDPDDPNNPQAQTLMRASKRATDGTQASLWSLRTGGESRQKVTINRPNDQPAFEFDVNKQWTVRPAVAGPPDDPAVLERLRERVADLEAVLRGIAKRIS